MAHPRVYPSNHNAISPPVFFWDAESSPYPIITGYRFPIALADEEIDRGLRELVKRINLSEWMTTVSCCEGHPERDEYGILSPELWLRIADVGDVGFLFLWVEKARRARKKNSNTLSTEAIINVDFVGQTVNGFYFRVWSEFISLPENERILDALLEAF